MKQQAYIAYFDVLRVMAILAVITLHVAIFHFQDTNVFSFSWEMSNLYDGLMRWGVPVFVMISGALFLDPSRERSTKQLYAKNILHIACVLIFWSVCYAGLAFAAGSGQKDITKLISYVILGAPHLWFLYMLLGLYILVPLLRPLCKEEELTRYFLILAFIFSFFLPTVNKILTGLQLVMPYESIFRMHEGLTVLVRDNIRFYFTLEFVSYFVLGYYINKISLLPWQRKTIYLLGGLSWIASICFARFVSHTTQVAFDFYAGCDVSLYVLFEALAVFVFVKYNFEHISARLANIFHYLSGRVLGIYLMHAAVQGFLNKVLGLNSSSFNPAISIPLLSLVIFVLSWMAVEVLLKIPFCKKYIL